MQWRIEQADRYRQACHDVEQLDEVLTLHWQYFGERGTPAGLVRGHDHLAHGHDPIRLEEHMLRAAEANPFCPNWRACTASFGVSALARTFMRRNLSARSIIVAKSPVSSGWRIATSPWIACPVDPSMVIRSPSFSVTPATARVAKLGVDTQRVGARDARSAHAACDNGRVAGHAPRAVRMPAAACMP